MKRLRLDAEDAKYERQVEHYPVHGGVQRTREDDTCTREVAKEVGVATDVRIPVVAIAYVIQATPYDFPIIQVRGRKVKHLMAKIEALKISLSDE